MAIVLFEKGFFDDSNHFYSVSYEIHVEISYWKDLFVIGQDDYYWIIFSWIYWSTVVIIRILQFIIYVRKRWYIMKYNETNVYNQVCYFYSVFSIWMQPCSSECAIDSRFSPFYRRINSYGKIKGESNDSVNTFSIIRIFDETAQIWNNLRNGRFSGEISIIFISMHSINCEVMCSKITYLSKIQLNIYIMKKGCMAFQELIL